MGIFVVHCKTFEGAEWFVLFYELVFISDLIHRHPLIADCLKTSWGDTIFLFRFGMTLNFTSENHRFLKTSIFFKSSQSP